MTIVSETDAIRRAVAALIQQNASTVTITRTVYTTDEATGAQTAVSSITASFVARLYQRHVAEAVQLIQPAGMQNIEQYALLAPYDADVVQPSENVKQIVTIHGDTYQITTVLVGWRMNKIVSQHLLLKRGT